MIGPTEKLSKKNSYNKTCYMQLIQVLRTIGLPRKGKVFGLPQKGGGGVLYADVTNVTHKC